jgi:transcription antitermination factor NusG
MGQNWYALIVKHQHEKVVARELQSIGIEALLPVYKTRRDWSDRTKEIELPLISGYVFARIGEESRVQALRIPSVLRLVGFGGKPAPIDTREIAALRAAMNSKLPLKPWPYLREGDRVRVERGPLKDTEGVVLREKDSMRLVICVELLQRSVAVEVSPELIVPVKERTFNTQCAA